MKRILITGAGSYIGTQVKAYLGRFPERYAAMVVQGEREAEDNAEAE